MVRCFLASLALSGQTASCNTAAYCKARRRLTLESLQDLSRQLTGRMERSATSSSFWPSHRIRVVDGTCFSMPDTPRNQKAFPQSHRQKPGCGFPILRAVGLFSLETGAWLALTYDVLKTGELELFRRLVHRLRRGDILLADRLFCTYLDLYRLAQQGIDVVMRKHQRRTKGSATVKRLAKGDLLVDWIKMKPCPKGITRGQWQHVPDRLRLREISFVVNVVGFRTRHVTIVTSFLDAKQFPKEAFQHLYFQRWKVELFFKDIKISLAMDTLRCLSPEMIEKELWMFVIAYNLIRTLMLKAAYTFHKDPLRLSFKGTVSSLRQWTPALASPNLGVKDRTHLVQILLMYLAHDTVPLRPNRVEPRARKRRPKNYQLLTAPRLHFKECLNRAKYKKPA